ncbi:MAG: putative WD40-like beta Propeller containing protein [Firmicutes bacterium]|nr:putative WD40-like beta Propeller containing protein [Bacillota bacterium]
MLTIAQLAATGEVRAACWSPDGERIAFVWRRDGLDRIWVLPAAGGFPELLCEQTVNFENLQDTPQWSSAGDAIAFVAAGSLWTVPAVGGPARRVTDGPGRVFSPRWSPDGRRIAFITDRDGYDQIAVLAMGAGGAPAGWPQPLVRQAIDCRDPQWSPDGDRIAFTALAGYDDHPIYVVAVATGELTPVSPAAGSWQSPRWSPSGELVCIADADGWNNLWLIGNEPRQLTHGRTEKGAPCWSPSGRSIACTVNRGGHVSVSVVAVATGEEVAVGPAAGVVQQPLWSPDGTRLLFVHQMAARQPELFTMAAAGGEPLRLTCSAPVGAEGAAFAEPETVSYTSADGLEIPAFLYVPAQAKPEGAARLPAIVYPHGGPTTLHDAGWYPWLQYFVQQGYAVLAPNFRGSTGYGRDFELANKGEWGKKDLDDVVSGATYLRGLPWIDPQRIAVHGGSYGGYQALLALSKAPGTFCCGVSFYGVSNRFSSWRETDRIGKRNMERKLGKPSENRALYREASPLLYAGQVNVPLMLMHGQDDKRVPFGQSVELVAELKRLGIPVEFHPYPGEGHGFQQPGHIAEIYHKVERFLELYL